MLCSSLKAYKIKENISDLYMLWHTAPVIFSFLSCISCVNNSNNIFVIILNLSHTHTLCVYIFRELSRICLTYECVKPTVEADVGISKSITGTGLSQKFVISVLFLPVNVQLPKWNNGFLCKTNTQTRHKSSTPATIFASVVL